MQTLDHFAVWSPLHAALLDRVEPGAPVEAQRRVWQRFTRIHPSYAPLETRWLASRRADRSPLADAEPFVTYGALAFLEAFLRPDHRVFEWGSGGSTRFLGRRVPRGELLSIEHVSRWAAQVARAFEREEIWRLAYTFCPPERSAEPVEARYASAEGVYARGFSFERYVRQIERHPDAHFDLVFVDGRARMGCLEAGIPKVAPGGALLLDNSDYARYQPSLARLDAGLLRGWERRDFLTPGPYSDRIGWCTTAWLRPT